MAETDQNGPAVFASGKGRWKVSSTATYSDRSFDIAFGIRGGKLLMVMIIEADDGSKRVVKAFFRKRDAFNKT